MKTAADFMGQAEIISWMGFYWVRDNLPENQSIDDKYLNMIASKLADYYNQGFEEGRNDN